MADRVRKGVSLVFEVAACKRVHVLVRCIILVLIEVDLVALQADEVGDEFLGAGLEVALVHLRLEAIVQLLEAIKLDRSIFFLHFFGESLLVLRKRLGIGEGRGWL